jgi:hypothetical protein
MSERRGRRDDGSLYEFCAGRFSGWQTFEESEYRTMLTLQASSPVHILRKRDRIWWWFRGEFYYHSSNEVDPQVVKGLIIQKQKRDERRRQKAIEEAKQEEKRP